MDWSDIGTVIGKAAPLLGAALTGNIPGAIAQAGTLLAGSFGCDPVPDAIHHAILQSPDAAVKLAQIEADNRAELDRIAATERIAERVGESADIAVVDQTMQVEAKSEHWMQWAWRPFIGFTFGVTLFGVYFLLPLIGRSVPAIPETAMIAWGAILGVTAWHRGRGQPAATGR